MGPRDLSTDPWARRPRRVRRSPSRPGHPRPRGEEGGVDRAGVAAAAAAKRGVAREPRRARRKRGGAGGGRPRPGCGDRR